MNNCIYLETVDFEEKFSHSYAIAQSVKLSVFEDNVDIAIDKTKAIPKELADTGRVNVSQENLSKMIGSLFLLRSS